MQALQKLLSALRALFGKRKLDAEMDEEMRSHVEMRTQANIEAGMKPDEARYAASREFGWKESIKEDCREQRGVQWFEDFLLVIRFGARQLRKNPGFTTAAVLTLALGIGANTALFSIVNGVLLRPLPFEKSERLVTLFESNPAQGIEQLAVSPPNFADWLAQSRSFEEIACWTGPSDFNLVTRDGTEKVRACYPSSSLFRALRVNPQMGHGFTAEEDRIHGPQTALISDKLWRERFNSDPQAIGRSFTLDSYGKSTYVISGVMPPGFQFPEDTELWLASGWNGLPPDRRSAHWLNTLARLREGVTLSQAQAEMNSIQTRLASQYLEIGTISKVSIVPLLHQTVGKTIRTALFVLWGVVGAVLLITCANVANLTLARTSTRQKEIALRLALGAGRWRVVRQILVESIMLALLGGMAGILLGYCALKIFVAASPANIPRLNEVSIDGVALCFTLGVAIATGVLFGIAPAWQSSRSNLNDVLKEGSRAAGSFSSGRTRSGLVIAEVALATVLLAGAGLMLQSFARLLATNRGFCAESVITAELDFSVSGFTAWFRPSDTQPQVRVKELLEHVRQLPGVQSAGEAFAFLRRDNRLPVNWPFAIFGRQSTTEGQRPIAEHNAVSPGYFRALGIPLLRGRDFTDADEMKASGVAVVNESFVRRFFPSEEPLGQHVTLMSKPGPLEARDGNGIPIWYEIVGVVGDVKSLSAQPEPVPEIYRSYWQWPVYNPTIFIRTTGDASVLAGAIRREIKDVIPNLPAPKIHMLTDYVNESIAQPRFQAELLTLFGALALTLAACGIYGVLAYTVTQRRREIGVRMALGAQRSDVILLIVRQGLKLTLLGLGIGVIAALALTQFMRSLIYGVRPADPVTFAIVTLLLTAFALLACWLPARHAAKVDPMMALKYE